MIDRTLNPYIDEILGTPFKDKGREPGIGLDCWGTFMIAMGWFGFSVPDYGVSSLDTEAIHTCFLGLRNGPWRLVDGPGPGMALAMCLDSKMPHMVQHYGVCLDNRRFIHTLRKAGVLISKVDHRFFHNRIVGFYRWNG